METEAKIWRAMEEIMMIVGRGISCGLVGVKDYWEALLRPTSCPATGDVAQKLNFA